MKQSMQRGVSMLVLVGVICVLMLVGGGVYFFQRYGVPITDSSTSIPENVMKKDDSMMEKRDGDVMKKDDTVMEKKDGEIMKDESMTKFSGTVLAGSSAPLIDYNKADYDAALKSNKLVVLYFYANWCPLCRAEFPLMQEAFNQLDIDSVIGFRVSYKDNETDKDEEGLARQFGVAYQHTKVFIKNGSRVLNAPDSWNKDRYISEINKASTN
ncbi:MAG: thioredoxin family protein [Patescibacteria group bacterium]